MKTEREERGERQNDQAGPGRLQEKKFTRKILKSTNEIVGRKSFRDPETSQVSGTQGQCTWVIGHTGTDITPNPAVPQLTPPVTVSPQAQPHCSPLCEAGETEARAGRCQPAECTASCRTWNDGDACSVPGPCFSPPSSSEVETIYQET